MEGTTQFSGTHGKMHKFQDKYASEAIKNSQLSYQDAKKSALLSLKETFKNSKCNSQCIEQQLDEYHQSICGNDPQVYPASTTKSGQLLEGAKNHKCPQMVLLMTNNSNK